MQKKSKKIIFAVFFILPANHAKAATRTISNTGGNYNSTSTWVEGAVPTSADDVVATATSGQLTVNVSSAAKSVNFTNYTNTLTMDATLTVSGNVTLVSAMTINGTGLLTISVTAPTAPSLTSNGKTWPNSLTLNSNGTTYTFADAWTIGGNLTLSGTNGSIITLGNNLTVGGNVVYTYTATANSQINGADYLLNIGGNFTMNQTTGILSGTATIVMNGTGTFSMSAVTSGYLKNNLTFNTTGTITISGAIRYSTGTMTYTAGNIVTTGSTLYLVGSSTLNTNGIVWNNITNANVTTTLTSNLTASGNVQIGIGNGGSAMNGYTLYVGGNFSASTGSGGSVAGGTTKIVLNGTGTWSVANTDGMDFDLEINTTGTITIGTVYFYTTATERTIKYTAGNLITTNAILRIRSYSTHNIIFDLGGITIKELRFVKSVTYYTNLKLASDLVISGNIQNADCSLASTILSTVSGTRRKLTLLQGATQNLRLVNATDIDSSDGQTMWSQRGVFSNSLNWKVNSRPLTYSKTF
jgi:hypothetical protein